MPFDAMPVAVRDTTSHFVSDDATAVVVAGRLHEPVLAALIDVICDLTNSPIPQG